MTIPKEATREALPEPIGYLAYQQDDAKPVFFPSMPVLLAGTARWHPSVARVVPVHHADDLHALESERQAHAAEVERLRGDAERYKQLRRGQHWSVIDGMGYTLRAEQIDAAIDQAIARGKT